MPHRYMAVGQNMWQPHLQIITSTFLGISTNVIVAVIVTTTTIINSLPSVIPYFGPHRFVSPFRPESLTSCHSAWKAETLLIFLSPKGVSVQVSEVLSAEKARK